MKVQVTQCCWYHLHHIARPKITDIAQRYVERTSSSAEDGKAEGDISDALSSWEGSCTRRMVMIIYIGIKKWKSGHIFSANMVPLKYLHVEKNSQSQISARFDQISSYTEKAFFTNLI